jgi:hypothetical protein
LLGYGEEEFLCGNTMKNPILTDAVEVIQPEEKMHEVGELLSAWAPNNRLPHTCVDFTQLNMPGQSVVREASCLHTANAGSRGKVSVRIEDCAGYCIHIREIWEKSCIIATSMDQFILCSGDEDDGNSSFGGDERDILTESSDLAYPLYAAYIYGLV